MSNLHTQIISLKQNAWYGDQNYDLSFPANWSVQIIGNQAIPAARDDAVYQAIHQPIVSPSLTDLARNCRKVVILVDDLSRPTPASVLLGPVFKALAQAGVAMSQITILVAGGTHAAASQENMVKKIGSLPEGVKMVAHDCREGVVEIGRTRRGTPIWINREVASSDLKIAIGCIYPHPAAGFSGGSKLLAPGAAGYETIRILHDQMRVSKIRAGSTQTEFRDEIEQIAAFCGLNFIINVTINQERQPAAVFAGDRNVAFSQAVAYARQVYQVDMHADADIVLVDVYPFDADLQFAFDRGLWPLDASARDSTHVLLASCPMGLGDHELYPVSGALFARVKRRLSHFSLDDLIHIKDRISAVQRMLNKRKLEMHVISNHLQEMDIHKALPHAQLVSYWDGLLPDLKQKYENKPIKVALYRCAPLMIPRMKDDKIG